MKKLYPLLWILIVVNSYGQIINFPDANFKAKLLQPGGIYSEFDESSIVVDSNNDGEIEVSEVSSLLSIDISNANISDLTGISYFTSLVHLNCSNNLLQSINIGNENANLRGLFCWNNLLQSLSVDPAIRLKALNANSNQLSTVNFTFDNDSWDSYYEFGFVSLSSNNFTSFTCAGNYENLYLGGNPLTKFDFNGASIGYLDVSYTPLSSITGSGGLRRANFRNCQFTELDLTNVSFALGSEIFLGDNPVDKAIFGISSPSNLNYTSANSSFDISNFGGYNYCRLHHEDPAAGIIKIINCPNLSFLSMKNGMNYGFINCFEPTSQEAWTQSTLNLTITNCPSLNFMCVDEGEQEHIQEKINAMGLQNQIQVNSYCTFVPGGTYYTVNGTTRFDANANGCDPTDPAIPFQQFLITNGTQSKVISGNEIGNFEINVGEGSHTITPIVENPEYYSVYPASVTFNFPTHSSPTLQNFCISANQSHPDLEISVLPVTTARPGFDATYKIIYKNKGNQTESGTINFAFDDAVTDLVMANPSVSSQTTNSLNWSFTDLRPFESREIIVTLNVNAPTEIPAVVGGETLTFNATIDNASTDETPDDNTFVLNQTVVNSFDPNDKTCLEGNTITPEMAGKFVHYLIRFENTGTTNAENIVVKDMIDTTKFDINSLVPIDSSHPFLTKISNTNKVEFIFENINLPFDDANNDGYVAFKIKTKPNLVVGDSFSNTASIYFDYNFPIVTNTATTTIALLANQDFEFADYFKIYPVPVTAVLNIEMKQSIEVSSINIYNTLGQLVLVIPNAQQTKTVDVSGLKSGNYFVKINSDKGSATAKFVKF